MPSPAPRAPTPSVFSPLVEGPSSEVEREPTVEIREALLRDQAELQREVILWQRWIRYLALLVIAGGAVLVTPSSQTLALVPLLVVGIIHVAVVVVTGWDVQHSA